MPRHEQEPVLIEDGHSRQDEQRYSHPAYAVISGSRISGDTTLFGSDFVHNNFVALRINRAELIRNLSHDWHYGREEYIEVMLSEAQWATFVSSLNQGGGVPCTVSHLAKKSIPSIPIRRETDEVKKEARSAVASVAAELKQAIEDVEGEIGESLSKAKRGRILERMRSAYSTVAGSLPFMAETLEKHMEKTVERGKVEVMAFMNAAIQRAGIKALEGQAPLQLPAPKEGDSDA